MGEVRVKFLGSGDAFGHGGRLQACILLEAGGRRVLLDCGASAMISLRRFGVEPNRISGVILSHLHGDHFGGLPYFILDAQLHSKRNEPLWVAGPAGTSARLEQAMEVNFPGSSQVRRRFAVQVKELAPGAPWQRDGFNVACVEGLHPSGAPALALRVEARGKAVAYTGDTQWVDGLTPLLSRADLLIAEAYFHQKPIKFHLSYAELAARLAELAPGRTVLTHMSQDMLDHSHEVKMEVAEDGLELVI